MSLATTGERPASVLDAVIDDLVVANHVLYRQGVLDAFGHVSARHPEAPDRFLISRSLAPGLVGRVDILTLDLDGSPVGDETRRSYLERFIHSAIYRARPDVQSVVHSHSPSIIPFGATRGRLRPIYHMCAFLGAGSALFDIRDVAGNTDLLIRDARLGEALAAALGSHALVLMRGHGSTVVGSSTRQAVYRAVYAETGAKLQAQAEAMGEVVYLNEEEAAAASALSDAQLERVWDLWASSVASPP